VSDPKTRVIKRIRINVDKCNGCRGCEVICSASHSTPRYSGTNPSRARIRVIRDPVADIYVPVFAGEYTAAECAGRDQYTIDGKEYEECAFCRASCPSRDVFREPDSGLPLKCDMCESDPTLAEPLCVTWCLAEALIFEDRIEVAAAADGEAPDEIDAGLEALAKKHGWSKLVDAVGRMSKNGNG
jgi:benzoyl-CoA reductase subunit BamC